MRTIKELDAMMDAYRRRAGEVLLEAMTQRFEKKLIQKRIQLLKHGQVLDEAEWENFQRSLSKSEREILYAFFPEMQDRLARIVADQPLAAVIQARHGYWPLLPWTEAAKKVAAQLRAVKLI